MYCTAVVFVLRSCGHSAHWPRIKVRDPEGFRHTHDTEALCFVEPKAIFKRLVCIPAETEPTLHLAGKGWPAGVDAEHHAGHTGV